MEQRGLRCQEGKWIQTRDYQTNIYVTPVGRWIIKLQWQNGHSHRWWQHPYTTRWGVLYPHMLHHLRVLCEPEIPNCRLPVDDKRKRHGCKWKTVIKTDRDYRSSKWNLIISRIGFDTVLMAALNERYWNSFVHKIDWILSDF